MERIESFVEPWINLQAPVLEPIACAAGYAALLAAVVLVLNVGARRWFTAGQMSLMWGLVLIRLALPAAPATSFSLAALWNHATVALEQAVTPEQPIVLPALQREPASSRDLSTRALDGSPVQVATEPQSSGDSGDPLWAACLTWIAMAIIVVFPFVAVAILGWTAVVHWRFCRFLKRQIPTDEMRLLTLLDEARSRAGVVRTVSLYALDGQSQPAVCGLWSPAILLPVEATALSDDRLRMLLLHELAHVRRGDVAFNWMLMLLKAAHWWNPVFWLAASRFGALREQACDAFAVARGGKGSSKDYGEMLLHFAASGAPRSRWFVSIPASLLGFSPRLGRRGMRHRLESLRSATKSRSRVQKGLVASVAAVLAVTGWSEAKGRVREKPDLPWMPPVAGGTHWNTLPEESGEIVSIELDGSSLLRHHRESGLSEEAAREALTSMLKPGRPSADCQLNGDTLKVTARQSVVDDIRRQVEVWTESGFGQIVLETRIINSPQDLATPVGIGWQSMGQTRPSTQLVRFGRPDEPMLVRGSAATEHAFPVCVAAIDDLHAFKVTRAAQQDRRSNIMFAPKITVFNGGVAHLENAMRHPFVVGVEEKSPGKLKPTVKDIDEGMALTLCPTQNGDQSGMRITGRLELSNIVDVMTVGARTRSGAEVNVQVPRVNRVCIDVDSSVRKGETLLIGCLPSYERRGFMYLMITARTIEEIEARARTARR
ncbi:MAG TPA: M56 family metallopeptidase [Caulifigura sp.]|jgi:beta-lactamase regulating signal transducer with metallopeptidase domain|nr:M56 family metallopeptidase [Caulifigura sp.]